jgi:hypothetical protein
MVDTDVRKLVKFNEFRRKGSTSAGHFQYGSGVRGNANFVKKCLHLPDRCRSFSIADEVD